MTLLLLWIALWCGINTGPWVLERAPEGLLGWAHYLRTLAPLLVLAAAIVGLLARRAILREGGRTLPPSARWWALYGFAGLVACLLSPEPLQAAYWALCYLAPFAVLKLATTRDSVERLNRAGWAVATAFLGVMVVLARDALFVSTADGLSGYGVVNRVGTVAGMPMSRASGVSRFAAVPCLVAFGWLLAGSGASRVVAGFLAVACAAVVYLMQSRGSTLALMAALAFAMILRGGRARRAGALAAVLVGVAVAAETVPDSTVDRVVRHVLRTPDRENLATLGGRVETWERSWDAVVESPVLGHGPQADRYVTREHAHNTYVYAALQAGLLGLVLFAVGLARAWTSLVRAWRSGAGRLMLVQTGAILAFFTVRSVPEVCGALYGVDLMLLLPAMAHLDLAAEEHA